MSLSRTATVREINAAVDFRQPPRRFALKPNSSSPLPDTTYNSLCLPAHGPAHALLPVISQRDRSTDSSGRVATVAKVKRTRIAGAYDSEFQEHDEFVAGDEFEAGGF
jgi:hypothetical protein